MESMIYIGRFEQTADGKMRCSWSGSAVEAGFEGTCAKASLKSTAAEDYVDVVIDGKHRRKLVLRQDIQEYVLVQGLPYGSHRVRVIKRTEGSKSILTIGGFWYPDGKPAAVCPVRSRKIELIGDSITAGFGNEGPADWSGFQMATENACCTYGALTAEALDADAVIIAWSGMGLVQDLAGNRAPVMPELYCRTLATEPESVWDFFRSVPDLVIINLGTNDFHAPKPVDDDEFTAAYTSFLQTLRSRYPAATFLCVAGTISYQAWGPIQRAAEQLKKAGDDRIYCYRLTPAAELGEPNGTDGHPSLITHKRMAEELIPVVQKIMNWE